MSSETPLGKVRALGSARHGAEHWGAERVTSVATLFLTIWFFVSLARLPGLDQTTISQWLHAPLAAVPMLLFVVAVFWHLKDGLIVVVEDYVHQEGSRFVWVMLINLLAVFFATLALFCVLKIALVAPAAGA